MKVLERYQNGNMTTTLYEDGTRIRESEDDEFYPEFAENIDVHISDRCDHGCPMCYANCTKDGEYGDLTLSSYRNTFLQTLHPGTELAINLNFPLHPGLDTFLIYLRSHRIYVNATVNQDHFMANIDLIKGLIDKKLIWGLGISLTEPTQDFIDAVKEFPNAVIHVINGLFSKDDCEMLADHGLKILILGYKSVGRGETYLSSISENMDRHDFISRNAEWLFNKLLCVLNKFSVVSFDNLALRQLDVKNKLDSKLWEDIYQGDDGSFSFFINMVEGYFAKNSISSKKYPIAGKSIDEMFEIIRKENNMNIYEKTKKDKRAIEEGVHEDSKPLDPHDEFITQCKCNPSLTLPVGATPMTVADLIIRECEDFSFLKEVMHYVQCYLDYNEPKTTSIE